MAKFSARELSRILTRSAGSVDTPVTNPTKLRFWFNGHYDSTSDVTSTAAVTFSMLNLPAAIDFRYLEFLPKPDLTVYELCVFRVASTSGRTTTLEAVTPVVIYTAGNTGATVERALVDFGTSVTLNPFMYDYMWSFRAALIPGTPYVGSVAANSVGSLRSYTDSNVLDRTPNVVTIGRPTETDFLRTAYVGIMSEEGYNRVI